MNNNRNDFDLCGSEVFKNIKHLTIISLKVKHWDPAGANNLKLETLKYETHETLGLSGRIIGNNTHESVTRNALPLFKRLHNRRVGHIYLLITGTGR